jgi:hypothetical protein
MRYLIAVAATGLLLSAAGCHHKKHSKTPEPQPVPEAAPMVEPAPPPPAEPGPVLGPAP